MDINYSTLDLSTLKKVYTKEVDNLKNALLEGAEWGEIRQLRRTVTELEAALYKKIRTVNPAEFSSYDSIKNQSP
jgi:hypothetical protein